MATFWLLVRVVLIVAVGVLAGSWLEGLARASLDRTRVDPAVRELITRCVRPLVVALAALIAAAHVGFDMTGAVAVAAAAILALGLSWREALGNGAAGTLLLSWRPYRTGDRVWIAGVEGVVTELTLFGTTIETEKGVHVTLANGLVLQHAIENHSRKGVVRVDVVVSVASGADFAKIAAAMVDAVASDERFAKEPAATLTAEGIGGDGLVLQLSAWVKADDAQAGRSALVLVARDVLKKAKVELAPTPR